MIEIVNRQRKVKLETEIFRSFVERSFHHIDEIKHKTLTVAFVSDRKMRELNKQYRGKDKTTDVLSFGFEPDDFDPSESYLGDIIISAEQAARQAKENNLTLDREIKQLILHGVLHLCGYDHETDSGEMNARELELRDKLGIS